MLSVLSNLQPRTRRPRDDLKRGQKGKENLDHVTSVRCNPPKSPKSGFPVAYGFVHFCKVPPFLHAVIFTLFRTRSAFAWESSPALTVQLQPNPVPKWEGVVKDWFDHLPFATAAFRPGWVRVVLSIGHPRLRSTAVLAGSGSVPTMAIGRPPLRNSRHRAGTPLHRTPQASPYHLILPKRIIPCTLRSPMPSPMDITW